jgi:hypothetical protein
MEEITNTPATIDDAAANAPEAPVDKGKLPLEGNIDVFYVNPGQAVVVKSGSHIKRLFHLDQEPQIEIEDGAVVDAVIWAPQSEA